MLQVRLGEAGKDAMGFAVHVPHYLAENRFPGAALALVHAISAATGLLLPSKALLDEAAVTGRLVDEQVEASEDASAVVNALETQYDAAAGSLSRKSLLADSTPSAEELGAEVEQFLGRTQPQRRRVTLATRQYGKSADRRSSAERAPRLGGDGAGPAQRWDTGWGLGQVLGAWGRLFLVPGPRFVGEAPPVRMRHA